MGPTVTRFAQIVQGVLCNEGLFSSAPRIRIIQCDTQIVAEDVIDAPEHMRKWIEGLRIHGGGGTDLRPCSSEWTSWSSTARSTT